MEKNNEIKINLQTAVFIAIIIIALVSIVIISFKLNKENSNDIKYNNLTETIWNDLKSEIDNEGNQKYYFMTNNIIKNSDNTYTIKGAIYELLERTQQQASKYKLNQEKGYYQITVSENLICTSIADDQMIMKQYYDEYYSNTQNKPYEKTIYSNSGENFVFENGTCVEYKYDGR